MSTPLTRERLIEQRVSLCAQLQQNRKYLAVRITNHRHEFPRSHILRFFLQKERVKVAQVIVLSIFFGVRLFFAVSKKINSSELNRYLPKQDNKIRH